MSNFIITVAAILLLTIFCTVFISCAITTVAYFRKETNEEKPENKGEEE